MGGEYGSGIGRVKITFWIVLSIVKAKTKNVCGSSFHSYCTHLYRTYPNLNKFILLHNDVSKITGSGCSKRR